MNTALLRDKNLHLQLKNVLLSERQHAHLFSRQAPLSAVYFCFVLIFTKHVFLPMSFLPCFGSLIPQKIPSLAFCRPLAGISALIFPQIPSLATCRLVCRGFCSNIPQQRFGFQIQTIVKGLQFTPQMTSHTRKTWYSHPPNHRLRE